MARCSASPGTKTCRVLPELTGPDDGSTTSSGFHADCQGGRQRLILTAWRVGRGGWKLTLVDGAQIVLGRDIRARLQRFLAV